MIQNNSLVIPVTSTTTVLLNIVDNAYQPRAFWFENLDDVNTMTLMFNVSADGGNTWAPQPCDGDVTAAFALLPNSSIFKKITNTNLLQLTGSGEGLLHVGITRSYPNNAVTVQI